MKFLMSVCRDESIKFTPEDRRNIGLSVQVDTGPPGRGFSSMERW